MKWLISALITSGLILMTAVSGSAAGIEYPQIITTRDEAVDQKTDGNFVIWSDREKIFYGPAAE
jgi:hypothetical protein